ncbi:single-stranded DNA-binding protein [Larkinella harenae]
MPKCLNQVQIIGYLGRDPEIRRNQADMRIAGFTVATSESYKDKNTGERRDYTQWHRIVIFNDGLSGIAESYLKKGSRVFIRGQLENRKWTDENGKDHFVTEIVLRPKSGEMIILDRLEKQGEHSGADYPEDDISTILDDEIPY